MTCNHAPPDSRCALSRGPRSAPSANPAVMSSDGPPAAITSLAMPARSLCRASSPAAPSAALNGRTTPAGSSRSPSLASTTGNPASTCKQPVRRSSTGKASGSSPASSASSATAPTASMVTVVLTTALPPADNSSCSRCTCEPTRSVTPTRALREL